MRHDIQNFSTDEICLAHKGRNATLLKTVSYTDKDGIKYTAKRNMPTDGGSLPRAFWDTLGPPYASKYLPAYILHDHGCLEAHELNKTDHEEAVALRLEYDQLFLEMLKFLGCNRFKAWLMFKGVRMGARSMNG